MSDQATQAAVSAQPFPWRIAMPWLITAGLYLLLLTLSDRLLADPDIYWHVRVGEWIIENRAFPHVDTFSYTFAGAPWIAKEWLSQLAFAAARHLAGWAGVAALAALAAAAAFMVLTRILLEKLDPVPTLVLVLAAIVLTAPHILARPHTLALPVMVVWTAGLVGALEAGRAPSWWLLPLMTLWANLHGGFTFGILLAAACGLEALLNSERAKRKTAVIQWGTFGALTVLAACVTPYGVESILMTQRILGLGEALSLLIEWRQQDFSQFSAFEFCLLGGIGFALYRGLTLPPIRIVIILGLLHMALVHTRNAELLALVAPLFIAGPLRDRFGQQPHAEEPAPRRLAAGLGVVAAIATLGSIAMRNITPGRLATPTAALAALTHANAGPIFNEYGFGGYMISMGVAPFIDGRAELYGGPFVARHHHAVTLENLPDFLVLLDKYKIGATLLAPSRPAVALLDRLPEWQRLYGDDIAVVHVRKAKP